MPPEEDNKHFEFERALSLFQGSMSLAFFYSGPYDAIHLVAAFYYR